MNASGTAGRLFVGLIVVALLAGCACNPQTVAKTSNVAFESSNPVLTTGVLDVYAPAKGGPWPVVVMFHAGPPPHKERLDTHARRVADLGFVVFNATWGAGAPIPETYEQALPYTSQAACAVAFARAHAAEYGGDPATMILFGHSFGANFMAAMIAFARPDASAGCLVSTTPGEIDALVTWDGDWLLQASDVNWDERLAADPKLLDALTPLKHLPEHRDLKVVMLVSESRSEDLHADRPLPDPATTDAFFAPRDPTGDPAPAARGERGARRRQDRPRRGAGTALLGPRGAGEPRLARRPAGLQSHLPGHAEGWKVLLAAFSKAVAKD